MDTNEIRQRAENLLRQKEIWTPVSYVSASKDDVGKPRLKIVFDRFASDADLELAKKMLAPDGTLNITLRGNRKPEKRVKLSVPVEISRDL